MTERMTPQEFVSLSYEEKIDVMMEAPESIDLPEEAAYVAQYLMQYRPLNPPTAHLDNETSLDIQDTMQGICPVTTKVISRIMKMLGYRLHIQGVSQPTWSMKHVESV